MSTSSFDTIAFRLSELLLRFNAGEALEIKKLADEFGVNERTIRRDLNERFNFLGLEKKGSAIRCHATNWEPTVSRTCSALPAWQDSRVVTPPVQ